MPGWPPVNAQILRGRSSGASARLSCIHAAALQLSAVAQSGKSPPRGRAWVAERRKVLEPWDCDVSHEAGTVASARPRQGRARATSVETEHLACRVGQILDTRLRVRPFDNPEQISGVQVGHCTPLGVGDGVAGPGISRDLRQREAGVGISA